MLFQASHHYEINNFSALPLSFKYSSELYLLVLWGGNEKTDIFYADLISLGDFQVD